MQQLHGVTLPADLRRFLPQIELEFRWQLVGNWSNFALEHIMAVAAAHGSRGGAWRRRRGRGGAREPRRGAAAGSWERAVAVEPRGGGGEEGCRWAGRKKGGCSAGKNRRREASAFRETSRFPSKSDRKMLKLRLPERRLPTRRQKPSQLFVPQGMAAPAWVRQAPRRSGSAWRGPLLFPLLGRARAAGRAMRAFVRVLRQTPPAAAVRRSARAARWLGRRPDAVGVEPNHGVMDVASDGDCIGGVLGIAIGI
ncbi:hypothetical protein EJB05_57985, partial [Eragrostis curvula]